MQLFNAFDGDDVVFGVIKSFKDAEAHKFLHVILNVMLIFFLFGLYCLMRWKETTISMLFLLRY